MAQERSRAGMRKTKKQRNKETDKQRNKETNKRKTETKRAETKNPGERVEREGNQG